MNVIEQPVEVPSSSKAAGPVGPQLTTARRISYFILIGMIVLVGWLKLGTPLITILFSYFVLEQLRFLKRPWLKVTVFLALVTVICAGMAYFLDQSVRHLPKVADKAIPTAIQYAKQHGLELPFSDWESLKDFSLDSVKGELRVVGHVARNATTQVVFLIIGIVIATSIFLSPFGSGPHREEGRGNNLYVVTAAELTARFKSFYHSFARVMGAQLIISSINTTLTAIFILGVGMPFPVLAIGITFLCGMLPIVGNLLSNTVLVSIALTSPSGLQMAGWALIFLVVIHKLEYFLNSKIIGRQIKNPVWLTLIGLVLGERLMGITGMILAPVILHFIREELSRVKTVEG